MNSCSYVARLKQLPLLFQKTFDFINSGNFTTDLPESRDQLNFELIY